MYIVVRHLKKISKTLVKYLKWTMIMVENIQHLPFYILLIRYWHNPFSFWLIDSKVISTIWVWLIGRPVSKGLNRSKGCTFYILHFTRLTDLTDVQMFRFDILYILYILHSWHLTLLTFDIVEFSNLQKIGILETLPYNLHAWILFAAWFRTDEIL